MNCDVKFAPSLLCDPEGWLVEGYFARSLVMELERESSFAVSESLGPWFEAIVGGQ